MGKATEIRERDFLLLAQECEIRKPKEIMRQVQDSIAEWPRFATELGVSQGSISSIQAQHRLFLRGHS